MGNEKGFNVHAVFRAISAKLRADFDASAQIQHSGGKGSSRESAFREFLATYLPTRYRIGHGEVLHWTNRRSRQCDVVIFDHVRCPRLLADDEHSVFPLESVYGTIEVKSVLTHDELRDAFEKIVSVKSLVQRGVVTLASQGMSVGVARPMPYGAIFAYQTDRTLQAIHKQLLELEADLGDGLHTPDVVVALGAGIVGRRVAARGGYNQIDPTWLSDRPVIRETKQHTLLRFYLEMTRELNTISLEPLDLHRYLRMPELIDGRRVSGHGRLLWLGADRKPRGGAKKIGPSGIRKIVDYCNLHEQVTNEDHLRAFVGPNLDVTTLQPEWLRAKVHIYNPRHRKLWGTEDPSAPSGMLVELKIDDMSYMVDLAALDPTADFLDDDDATFDELFNA